jgi:uncharacterized protein YndB with AHSA1/START domain
MPAYRATVAINAGPQRVYEVVADLARHGEWSADPLEITPAGEDRFRSQATSKGKKIAAEVTVVERVPNERLVFEVSDVTGRWVHRFTFAPEGGGTRVVREISGKLSGGQLVLFWLVLLPIKKPNARRALERLKERLEA